MDDSTSSTGDASVVAEFLVEPFTEGSPGPHVLAAVAAAERDGLDPQMGPFGTSVTGSVDQVASAVRDLLVAAMASGASRVQIHVDRLG